MPPSKARRVKSLAEQIAELDDPAPKDFDPEDVNLYNSDSEQSAASDNEDEGDNARAHYEPVGKSKLRKPEGVSLGPQYAGSRISRDAVEDEDSDDPFGREYDEEEDSEEEDETAFAGAQESTGEDDESEEEAGEDGIDTSGTELSDQEDYSPRHGRDDAVVGSELRRLMADDQKKVAATLSEGAKADAEKGRAVKRQRATFDSLLNSRIKLQKALISVNSLVAIDVADAERDEVKDIVSSAETAAIRLWNNLNSLRSNLQTARTGKKRSHEEISSDTPPSSMWKESQSHEADQIAIRNSGLNFWSAKCRATTALPAARGRLNQSSTQQNLTDVLAGQMADMPRLVARTQVPRSCAPLQAATATAKKQGPADGVARDDSLPPRLSIYDDADFYSTLLQTLITQRSNASGQNPLPNLSNLNLQPWQAAREAKTKKVVDTKASKGRKLRYTVHEKLQNFMAAEDRGVWGERQADELFGSLFGRTVGLGEDEHDDVDVDENGDAEAEGLRLFAGL